MPPALRPPQKLSAKLVGIQVVFLAVALISIGLTLVVSWRLEGSAAAINDAGSLRMRTYRLAYLTEELARTSASKANGPSIARDIAAFEEVVATLRHGDPGRPLFVPKTDAIAAQFAVFDREWAVLKPALERAAAGDPQALSRPGIERFVGEVNAFVATLEQDITRTTSLLRTIQLALVALAIVGAVALIYLSFLFIIRPVHQIEDGLRRMGEGDFAARVPVESKDEFGALAEGFNHMAAHLEESYRLLEGRVAEKTRSLAAQNARLATLYDMTAFLNAPNTQEELCRGFLRRLLVTTGAAAGAVRLVSRDGETLHLFVEEGLPASFAAKEHCLQRGECACGEAAAKGAGIVHFLGGKRSPITMTLPHCREAGFALVSAYPIAAQQQVLGVYNLFHRELREIGSEERHMLDSLGQHLGVAIESLRLVSSERELAIAGERNLLAQELHDSIAQALAFLNLQVQMLRKALAAKEADEAARVLEEIQAGVQESYADVRELLVHFRTRTGEGDVEHGIRTMLAKFQHQTGIKADLSASGSTVPLAPDAQLQAMHILQEALSNVRKHARASRVDVELARGPGYRFVVRDDGRGFDPAASPTDTADHVGLRIMRERAERIGGEVQVRSQPGGGTEVVLTLPVAQREAA
jgi:two-component system, NarL family, nitrate/nitrite sensor histidine kinase NarX